MIVIANWKQNQTYEGLKGWVETFDSEVNKSILDNVEVVIAPAFPHIVTLKMIAHKFGYFKLASQDISSFENGAHTGEVGAFQLNGLVDYAILGHSERRKRESIDDINAKIENTIKADIVPVVCFSTEEEFHAVRNKFANEKVLFAYEPPDAISTAVNSIGAISTDKVRIMVEKIGLKSVIYGGSVDENNIGNYLNSLFITGFLVGNASLDPARFAKIVNKLAPK